jgi:hypothetical protein
MSDRGYSYEEIQEALDEAAQVMAAAPPEQWPGWMRYFLEALEAQADVPAYRAMIEALREDLTIRLEVGRW